MKETPAAGGGRLTVTMKLRVLVVEDNARTQEAIALYLRHAGYEVDLAATGPDALASAAARQPDLIVLDLMLPGLSGLDVCRTLRARTDVPIIMVTARTTEEDKLEGLRSGADDYVTKPFSPRELVARVAAVLRRARPGSRVISTGGLEIDLTSREVRRDGVAVSMTPAEFRLLEVLASNPGRAWTRADLGERAFGLEYDALDRTIDAHVMNLRRKLERDRGKPELIQTVFGIGYRFRSTADPLMVAPPASRLAPRQRGSGPEGEREPGAARPETGSDPRASRPGSGGRGPRHV
jgi:DNA-binding response OmpR family regulator